MNYILVIAISVLVFLAPSVPVTHKYRSLRETGKPAAVAHAHWTKNAVLWGGGVPLAGIGVVLMFGLISVNTSSEAEPFFGRLAIFTASFVVASTAVQVAAHVESRRWYSEYLDLGGKMGLLTTSAITVAMLLTENGVDLIGSIISILDSTGVAPL